MAEIINLRHARKVRHRLKKRAQGNENSVKFGRDKLQQSREATELARAKSDLDGKKRES
ncbi:MAG: DUF4169 family protein [Pseudorhodobacter sp.]